MAGIGFELQKLMKSGGIFGQLHAMVHGAIIAAGPWIFTVFAIGFITLVTEAALGLEFLAEFRANIIYSFALSLVATAPVVIISTRMVSDAIYNKSYTVISHVFFAALFLGALSATTVSFLFYPVLVHLAASQLATAVISTVLVGMIWVTLAFCSAVRDFRTITIAFAAGLIIAVICAFMATWYKMGIPGLVWGFDVGLGFTLYWLVGRVMLTFPDVITRPLKAVRAFVQAAGQHGSMALAAMFSVSAIWIDKWVMWLGPAGEILPAGFIHAPVYDSAMFIAYLVIIPALSLFIINLESDFFRSYQRYYADITAHATLQQIRKNADELASLTHLSLSRILIIQAALCVILILFSPNIIEMTGMQYQQTSILRLGIVGALFQFLFLACSSLLLFFNRNRRFFYLQTLFLVLNGGLTFVTMNMGEKYFGFGYLLASLISGLVAYAALDNALKNINYTTFMHAATNISHNDWLANWQ